jgi:hypothetical protein
MHRPPPRRLFRVTKQQRPPQETHPEETPWWDGLQLRPSQRASHLLVQRATFRTVVGVAAMVIVGVIALLVLFMGAMESIDVG